MILMTDNHRVKSVNIRLSTGFTLLEVMVALTIIATVLISVYKLHAQSLSLAHETRFYGLAPFLAQQKLTELTVGEKALPENETGDFGEDFPNFRWKVEVAPLDSGFQEKEAIAFAQLDLTVFSNTNQFSYQIRTYRLAPH